MNNYVLKVKVITSLFWKLMERIGTQSIQFIIQVVLARILLPKDFGIVAIVTIFITIFNVMVQSGFNTALIQKKNADEIDFSSVYFLSFFIALFLYTIIFFLSPYIADFYLEPQLDSVLKILSITLFFGAINSIQNAYVARKMMFEKLFISSLFAVVISGVVGISIAYLGGGIWALVFQQLTNQISITIVLWYTVRWRPMLVFSFSKVKELFSYGSKLLIASLIDTLYNNMRSLIIGKIYNPSILGFYTRGQQFPAFIVNNINGSIQSVMLPVLSSQQDNRLIVKNMVRRSISTSSFIIFPIMVGLAVTSEPLIKFILTDKWLPAVPFMQIFCASYALWPIHTANLQAINALGRSDLFLKLEIMKKTLGIIILVISVPFGIYAMTWGVFLTSIISTIINTYPNLSLINYSYKEQLKDIMPSLFLSLIMGLIVYTIKFLSIQMWQILILQVLVGIIIYTTLAKIFRIEIYIYLIRTINDFFHDKVSIFQR